MPLRPIASRTGLRFAGAQGHAPQHRLPDHQRDQASLVHLFRCEGSDLAPVAKHCDAIRDREDLIESMRDVEDAETPFGNTTDGGEENLDLHAREG